MTPGLNFTSSKFVRVLLRTMRRTIWRRHHCESHEMTIGTCIFTIDITCCSLHIAPGLKGHDFKAFSCSTDSFFLPVRL